MEYLRLEDVSKTYGTKVLLDGVSLTISAGEKIALIAKNGSGKTTLLRIIAGIESGEGQNHKILLNDSARLGFLTQDPQFGDEMTVMDVLLSSTDDKIQALAEYKKAQHINTEEALHQAGQKMDDLQIWNLEAQIYELLAQLKLENTAMKVGEMSGGQVKRLALAKIILEDHDFLILDEPTNHLDLEMIEWLEEYLQRSQLTLFMVTHDRYFLERVCNHILELERGRINKFKGNYSDYLYRKEAMQATEASNLDKSKKLLKRELEWMRRQPKARGTKAKSRIDDYHELKSDIQTRNHKQEELQFHMQGRRLGKKILEFRDVSFSFDEKPILLHFDYKFKPFEKVGLIGPNGAGKTSFIRLMTGELKPLSGRVVQGETVFFGHYRQDGLSILREKRVVDVVRDVAEYLPLKNGKELSAEQLLERFLFNREQQQVFANQLSGGELKRLQLLVVLMSNPNFLILDEPTNDLDILTLNVLEEFLKEFPGCLIIISHDRYFLDKLVDHLFVLDGKGNVKDYNGGYSDFREEYGKGFDFLLTESPPSTSKEKKATDNKIEYELRKEIKKLEKELDKFEKEKISIGQLLSNSALSVEEITDYSIKLKEIDQSISVCEEKWMTLAEQLE